MKSIYFIVFWLMAGNIGATFAQIKTEPDARPYRGLWLDASFGFFLNPGDGFQAYGRLTGAAGFQYGPFALGPEWVKASNGGAYNTTEIKGVGIQIRYVRPRILGHFSMGRVYDAIHFEDNSVEWTYKKPAGTYFKLGAGWRFAGGALYGGMSVSGAPQLRFDYLNPDERVPVIREDRLKISLITFDFGFTFPGKTTH